MSLTVLPSNGAGGYDITDSLRFRGSQYLTRTPSSAGNRRTYTFSAWVKTAEDGTFMYAKNGNYGTKIAFSANQFRVYEWQASVAVYWDVKSTAVYRDPSAWYHLVVAVDTTQATASDRVKLYVNGEQVTSLATATYPSQNYDCTMNTTVEHFLGKQSTTVYGEQSFVDGYMTEVNFVDGQALTPSDFGEYNPITGVWQPKAYTGTYGTNGFYLPMKETTQVTGFNTVLYTGTGANQNIRSVGFNPDLLWIKSRSAATNHRLYDTIRGSQYLVPNSSAAAVSSGTVALQTDGFVVGTDSDVNNSGQTYVAWCWDAGDTTVSNTDGTITSTVRANPESGFSIVKYVGTGSTATVGHGLNSAPKFIIQKHYDIVDGWFSYHVSLGSDEYMNLWTTAASGTTLPDYWGPNEPTDSVFGIGTYGGNNTNGGNHIAYCFSEVSGYSKFGSYTGNGSTTGPTITTGFRPAFVMVKRTDTTQNWGMYDNTRNPSNPVNLAVFANASTAEDATTNDDIDFTDTGFQMKNTGSSLNASGGTYIYMAFADTRDFQWNFDASGNKNNWTPNNINSNASSETTYDLMSDTPSLADEDTGNFATLNPLVIGDGGTMSDGNLTFTTPTATRGFHAGTIGMTSGKWYWEVTCSASTYNATNRAAIGYKLGNERSSYVIGGTDGDVGNMGFYTGDTVGFAFDADNGTLENFINGVSNATTTGIDMTKTWFPIGADAHTAQNGTVHWNFGQRPFKYTPPAGYKKLNTYNLPDSSIIDGSQYFNTVVYTGDGGTSNSLSYDFSPDLVWSKSRSNAEPNILYDSIRGTSNYLLSNSTNAEATLANPALSFDSNGHTWTQPYSASNFSGYTYVNWSWRGSDSTAVSNTDGTITSTVSANTTSGFSIVTFTGTGAGATVGHGLSQAPEVYIRKSRSNAENWYVYTTIIDGSLDYLTLDTTNAKADSGASLPNATTFEVGAGESSGEELVTYCFHSVEGFSKFGTYTGNGSADGPFVYTGFRPAFIIMKNASDGVRNWLVMDTARSTYNQTDHTLEPNLSNAENPYDDMDILSNGFKMRTTDPGGNGNGNTIVYMAFAENPFKNSLAR